MEKKVVELDIQSNVQESIAGLKQLKRQLKDTAAGSEEFKKIYNQIDDLEDKIKSSKNASSDWVDSLERAGGPLGMLGTSINNAKVATQSFGGALKATGIGLIVSLLGGLVAAFSENEGAMKKLQPLLDGIKKIFQGVFRAVEPLFNTMVDLATDALPYVTKGIGAVYSAMMAYFTFLKESGAGAMKILKGVFTLDGDAISEGIDQVGGSFKKTQQSYGESMKRFTEGSKELTESEKAEIEKREENRKAALEKKAENEQKAKDKAIKKAEEEKAELDRIAKEKLDAQMQSAKDAMAILDELNKSRETPAQKEQREYLEKKAILEANNLDTALLTQTHNETLDAINKTAAEKIAADKKAITDKTTADEKAAVDAKILLVAAEKKAKLDAADETAKTLSAMSDLLGKETAAGKAAAVASATINTFSSAQKAYDATVGIPYVGPVLAPINAGLAIVAGIKNVKSILAVKVPGGGGGGSAPSGGATGAGAAAPQFNVVGNTGVNQLAQTLNQEQPPIKTYVVAGDVTTGQSLDRNIITNASLG
jgi:chemotaxis protein histidine kinase CheA